MFSKLRQVKVPLQYFFFDWNLCSIFWKDAQEKYAVAAKATSLLQLNAIYRQQLISTGSTAILSLDPPWINDPIQFNFDDDTLMLMQAIQAAKHHMIISCCIYTI
jgi:hypothetical protein